MVANSLMIIVIVFSVIAFIYIYVFKGKNKQHLRPDSFEDKYSVDRLIEFTKNKFTEILKTNLYEMNLSKDEFTKRMQNRNQLRKALKDCTYGDLNAKNYVKSYIRDILVNLYGIDELNINKVINFDNPKELNLQDKFEILLYTYKKQYKYNGLEELIIKNKLDLPKDNEEGISYIITAGEIDALHNQKVKRLMTFEDRLEIVIQRVYQNYKGYGVIDEIRDMKIDGVSGGVSGIPTNFSEEIDVNLVSTLPFSYDSVWIFFQGKTIHLSFLSFGSERELIRVCKNIYRYNNPGQLSESNGYKINEMKDGSRVVVARPPFSESWVFFVRKFDSVKKANPEELIVDENNALAIGLIKWLVKGCRVTAVTGSQGTGKTTLLMSIIKFINPAFTLRIQETAFELNLRKIYPSRNILTFRETSTISGQEGLDLQKKTDGTVNILGEVATAPVASWMIQMAQVASLFTIFTHHAKTTENLVFSLRNNLLQTGAFSNEKVAEQQVADVVNFDIHLNKSVSGHRYIERITEIIPTDQYVEYPSLFESAKSHEQKVELFLDTMKEFFIRVTDRKTFEVRDIIRYEEGKYKACQRLSESSVTKIIQQLKEEDRSVFKQFLTINWKEHVKLGKD